MARQEVNDKVKILKGVLNGTVDFGTIRAPQHYIVIKQFDEQYKATGYLVESVQLTIDQYEQWRKTVREIDGVIELPEQKNYTRPVEVLPEEPIPTIQVEEPAKEELPEPIREPIIPVKERILIPLAEHRAMNQRLSKLFK